MVVTGGNWFPQQNVSYDLVGLNLAPGIHTVQIDVYNAYGSDTIFIQVEVFNSYSTSSTGVTNTSGSTGSAGSTGSSGSNDTSSASTITLSSAPGETIDMVLSSLALISVTLLLSRRRKK